MGRGDERVLREKWQGGEINSRCHSERSEFAPSSCHDERIRGPRRGPVLPSLGWRSEASASSGRRSALDTKNRSLADCRPLVMTVIIMKSEKLIAASYNSRRPSM